MKKHLFLLVLLTVGLWPLVQAQNIQLHYDFGTGDNGEQSIDREYFTTTLEMFKTDNMGATYWFVDMDYNAEDDKGMSFAYWEIVRTFQIPKVKYIRPEIAYNDGMFINRAWLFGVNIPVLQGETMLTTSLYYRAENNAETADFQFTAVWLHNFFNNRLTFYGFVDLWTMDKFDETGEADKQTVFLTEPQLWYNLNEHFSLGGEIEISKNFISFDDDVEVMPTLGAKWIF